MDPPIFFLLLCFSILSVQSFATLNAAFVLTSKRVSKEDLLTFKKGSGKFVPALLTKISIFFRLLITLLILS